MSNTLSHCCHLVIKNSDRAALTIAALWYLCVPLVTYTKLNDYWLAWLQNNSKGVNLCVCSVSWCICNVYFTLLKVSSVCVLSGYLQDSSISSLSDVRISHNRSTLNNLSIHLIRSTYLQKLLSHSPVQISEETEQRDIPVWLGLKS